MVIYKDVVIRLNEAHRFDEPNGFVQHKNPKGMLYRASSKFGKAFALCPTEAIELAQKQIDSAT